MNKPQPTPKPPVHGWEMYPEDRVWKPTDTRGDKKDRA